MRVSVLVFGVLKDVIHGDSSQLDLPDGSTVQTLLDFYRGLSGNHHSLWSSIAVAVNRQYVTATHLLADGDEVALLPPVSGGSPVLACETALKGTGFSPYVSDLISDEASAAEGLF
jgi:molybdopterin converting factor small subunit